MNRYSEKKFKRFFDYLIFNIFRRMKIKNLYIKICLLFIDYRVYWLNL